MSSKISKLDLAEGCNVYFHIAGTAAARGGLVGLFQLPATPF